MSITGNFVQVVMSSLTGDVAELVCSVRGQPTPEVQWKKAGEFYLALATDLIFVIFSPQIYFWVQFFST